jgi:hypothetical protein
MESSRTRDLTTSQQLANLRLHRFFYGDWARRFSEMQDEKARESSPSQPTDTAVYKLARLGWQLAMQAQSCAYLAESLQLLAEKFSESQIECRELTYNQLCSSIETSRVLLATMLERFEGMSDKEDVTELLALSAALDEAIRLRLDRG